MLAVRVGWRAGRAAYEWSREPVVNLEPEGHEHPDCRCATTLEEDAGPTEGESEYIAFSPNPPWAESFLTAALRGAEWIRWGIWQAAMHEAQASERPWPQN